jgi:hypothetical protein
LTLAVRTANLARYITVVAKRFTPAVARRWWSASFFFSPGGMRRLLRVVVVLVVAVGIVTCSDTPSAAVKRTPSGMARLSFAPVFSKSAAEVYQRLPDFGVDFDRVRVVIVRPINEIVKDTFVLHRRGDPDTTIDINVDVKTTEELFNATFQWRDQNTVYFQGSAPVRAHAPDAPAPPPAKINVSYVGPGAKVAKITIGPRTTSLSARGSQTFTIQATDSSGAPVTDVPVNWSLSDASLGTLSASGLSATFAGLGRRGTVTVSAEVPSGATDQVSVGLIPPPSAIALVNGGGQTGVVGQALSSPVVLEVRASDGLPVSGVGVVFSPPVGGAVSPASGTTDVNGRVSRLLKNYEKSGGAADMIAYVGAASTGSTDDARSRRAAGSAL